ncbi:MAG: APC family permease [Opitutales bacterium]
MAEVRMLERKVGVFGAMILGLGSMLGSGVFVALPLVAERAGPPVVLAVVLAGLLATANGLSSAQLAANHPVSGGTYAYGRRWLRDDVGFLAGTLFLIAKSMSAATAVLGLVLYLAERLGWSVFQSGVPLRLAALGSLALLVWAVASGLRKTTVLNVVLVTGILAALVVFVVAGLVAPAQPAEAYSGPDGIGLFEATALLFVAYTGYGRIATLGEEIREPRKNIPRAIILTLAVIALVYVLVAAVVVRQAGAATGIILTATADAFGGPGLAWLIEIGAFLAFFSVITTLLLGLSRVLFAMGRDGEAPARFGLLAGKHNEPVVAILGVAGLIGIGILVGDLYRVWSFSAVTVLAYYGTTHLCALQLKPRERLFPRWIAWVGLAGCFGLALMVQPWAIAIAAVTLALAWLIRRAIRWRQA